MDTLEQLEKEKQKEIAANCLLYKSIIVSTKLRTLYRGLLRNKGVNGSNLKFIDENIDCLKALFENFDNDKSLNIYRTVYLFDANKVFIQLNKSFMNKPFDWFNIRDFKKECIFPKLNYTELLALSDKKINEAFKTKNFCNLAVVEFVDFEPTRGNSQRNYIVRGIYKASKNAKSRKIAFNPYYLKHLPYETYEAKLYREIKPVTYENEMKMIEKTKKARKEQQENINKEELSK